MSTLEAPPRPDAAPHNTVQTAGSPGDAARHSIFFEIFSEPWQYRELLWQMTLRDLRVRYKQAIMGFAWAILMPMLVVASGLMLKFAMSQVSGRELQKASLAGMALKAFPWSFFVGAINAATNSLVGNRGLVTKIYFPREVFPLSSVITQMCDSSIGSVALVVVLFGFLNVSLTWTALWALPLVVLILLFTIGVSLFLSCTNLFFRDVKYLVQVVVTFGIFVTPVLFDVELFGPVGAKILMLNPLAPLLEGLRLSVIGHHNLLHELVTLSSSGREILVWHPVYLAYSAGFSALAFLGSAWLFHKLEFVYAEYA